MSIIWQAHKTIVNDTEAEKCIVRNFKLNPIKGHKFKFEFSLFFGLNVWRAWNLFCQSLHRVIAHLLQSGLRLGSFVRHVTSSLALETWILVISLMNCPRLRNATIRCKFVNKKCICLHVNSSWISQARYVRNISTFMHSVNKLFTLCALLFNCDKRILPSIANSSQTYFYLFRATQHSTSPCSLAEMTFSSYCVMSTVSIHRSFTA